MSAKLTLTDGEMTVLIKALARYTFDPIACELAAMVTAEAKLRRGLDRPSVRGQPRRRPGPT